MLDMENLEKWKDAHQVKPAECVCFFLNVCHARDLSDKTPDSDAEIEKQRLL